MKTLLPLMMAALLLGGCASAPPAELSALHPASPQAAEGRRVARVTSLSADEATRKTDELLAAARREQERWESAGPEKEKQPEETHEPH